MELKTLGQIAKSYRETLNPYILISLLLMRTPEGYDLAIPKFGTHQIFGIIYRNLP